jgi:hypothetical protein
MDKFRSRLRVVWGVIVLATGLLLRGPDDAHANPPAP